jgi:uncharacterized protein (DUF4415 family)
MTENKRAIATDLKRLDEHVVQPAEYDDAPELTDAQLARADLFEGDKLIRRGRPRKAARKVATKLRLDPVVLERFRATGPGWQTRINEALLRIVEGMVRKSLQAHQRVKRKAKAKAKVMRAKAPRKSRLVKGAAASGVGAHRQQHH